MFLVDSHCHLDSLNYKILHRDVEDVADKARKNGVNLMLSICTSLIGFYTMTAMVGCRDDVLFSCGIHPLNLDKHHDFNELRYLAARNDVVALGETGLDYYYQHNNKIQQQAVFREHIHIGRALNKPVIVHMRNAREDALFILREEQIYECGGVLHCFTEDCATAKALLNLGLYISFSGIITFRNAGALHKVARYVPLDRLLLETDSPYLAPVPHRGKENQPAYVRNIAEYMATLKGVSLTKLAEITTANFGSLFHVDV
ncbi:putative deoxyribonuclease YcfH [Candidatus Gullanella endobia]|uniref:Putative deoxyribonuclease YcfH n=1 Tax=Candidatus Gullanella endobia TaxID=1070130 RepID=A0A143WTX6_9ENTR|nr:metal-dependent hydrolase [Candidatus Gullanella endobia]CUX96309.1 putative deoxyribonuclease YcfH [Candidatus Gullanella endobia]